MSKWEEFKNKYGDSRPWDVFDLSKDVTEDVQKKRMGICLECPELIKSTKQCKQCGCFMQLKTGLSNAECPIGKWNREE